MNEKQNQEDNKPPSGIINKLKKYFRNPFFIKTQSVSEVTEFLKDAVDQKIIDKEAESIASKAIRLGDITVKEIMIPKVDMVTIQVKDDTNEIIKRIIESGHSRYPVLGEERNEVAGILLAKDILPKLFKGTADFDINEMLRDPNVVPETKKADSLLEEFKQDRSHLAVVIDEYGEICGLITIEDILEELVGEIEDEHEYKMFNDFGACMIKNFPESTSPFWNMSRNEDGNTSKKIDVILGGMETIGSAERSTDIEQMNHTFHTISGGLYADLLYSKFGKDRVEKELEEFLSYDFMPRVGGGIGMTRMISALG